MPRVRPFAAAVAAAFLAASGTVVAAPDDLVRAALAAEARLETRQALDLFLAADKERPDEIYILQKIAHQYSDLSEDLPTVAKKKASVERALAYSRRAVALAPRDADNVLSVAICFGKLALYSDPRDKVRYSRLMREEAERALTLDPRNDWAHHLIGRWHYEVATIGSAARVMVSLFYGGLPAASTDEAVRHLRRAVELDPGQLAHHLELGFAYAAAHQPAAARAAFEAGLALPSREKHDESAKARARTALAKLAPDSAKGRSP